MKRILILIFVFTLMLTCPCVASASSVPEYDYKVDVAYLSDVFITFWNTEWTSGFGESVNLGEDVSYTMPDIGGSIVRTTFNLDDYISSYQTAFNHASKIYLSAFFNGVIDSGGIAASGFSQGYLFSSSKGEVGIGPSGAFNSGYLNGDLALNTADVTEYLKGLSGPTDLDFFYQFNTYFVRSQDASPLAMVRSFRIVFYLQGIDGQTYDQFLVISNDLNDIDNSVKQVASEVKVMQGQLNNIQSDINSGFNEVGGKLDSMLTPDSNNQQAVDQMGGQVNNNKQEAEDIKNQIDSLDKPDPDDLIDQIDPDQFIDNDDEAVQEMTGILASVTGSKVVKNYLLLLICVGIVSFVVYGKKGG